MEDSTDIFEISGGGVFEHPKLPPRYATDPYSPVDTLSETKPSDPVRFHLFCLQYWRLWYLSQEPLHSKFACNVSNFSLIYLWFNIYNRIPRNRLPRVMKQYSPTGRRNHGRPLKRLLDAWDRNGSTSGLISWKIDHDDWFMRGFFIVAPSRLLLFP